MGPLKVADTARMEGINEKRARARLVVDMIKAEVKTPFAKRGILGYAFESFGRTGPE